jgi:hypothetical protein
MLVFDMVPRAVLAGVVFGPCAANHFDSDHPLHKDKNDEPKRVHF